MTANELKATLILHRWFDSSLFDRWIAAQGKARFTKADLASLTKMLRDAYRTKTPGKVNADPPMTLAEAAAAYNRSQQKLPGDKRTLKIWGAAR